MVYTPVQLFAEAESSGVRYPTYVGDDDTTTESRLSTLVKYPVEKWSDINHVCRTLGSRLYAAKNKVKGLTPAVISYIQKCFTYCLHQNMGRPEELLQGLNVIVPHAFGDHSQCEDMTWCKYKANPDEYAHGELPGCRDLQGEDLRASITDALRPFSTPMGSSQKSECVNSIIGAKAPKIKRFGGSESSDHRTAAGIAQFNESTKYISKATEEMGLGHSIATDKYIKDTNRRRLKNAVRKGTRAFKKKRRMARRKKSRKNVSLEEREGVTYESGVGLQRREVEITTLTIESLKNSVKDEELRTYEECIEHWEIESQGEQSHPTNPPELSECALITFDTETTGLNIEKEGATKKKESKVLRSTT
ncbi:uncharacterized protein LOC116614111 [Nematostella vectensis]|uniref:uncharacterized protein LOC116614111 n=1 Tax=Nematostella vectensis TaxID=45351 RepID=UPI00207754EF|nr:uncharacterized protein LOC116614111 [Nematostella vectensis]